MYFQVSIPFANRSLDELSERLAELPVEGIEERTESLAVYFLSRQDALDASALLDGGPPEEMADQNWSEALQADWAPLLIGERFFLCPSWITAATPAGRIRLEMVPGNVFGGGDHPTTQLCLELLERFVSAEHTVADIGAGTGILTRAARALGARAVGCDIDQASSSLVDFIGSADALAAAAFDVVIANIHLGVLQSLGAELRRIARPGALLLVSGFLPEQALEITALFAPPVELRERGGWCAAIVRFPQ